MNKPYIIIESKNLIFLPDLVNAKAKGYQPVGGIFFNPYNSSYCQPMFLFREEIKVCDHEDGDRICHKC